ncbi:MAG TPA: hypothetical protein VE398_13580 [Acidobacteriota bacterium]|nr:hypothetical protein [Acidobacteriota bacterium]
MLQLLQLAGLYHIFICSTPETSEIAAGYRRARETMVFRRKRRFVKNKPAERADFTSREDVTSSGSTGEEAAYFRSSVDSHATVTVVLRTGERLRGRIRYYDRDCFSIGLVPRGPNVFLRKDSVLYISEE